MYNFHYRNARTATVYLMQKILTLGDEVMVRGAATKELMRVGISIEKPLERCLILDGRNDDIFAKIAESLWVMAGRNDIEWLSYYLPRAKDFSDDGKTWRAAYGARLRKWSFEMSDVHYTVDQVDECRKLLLEDPNTRRAVMSIFDPTEDYWYDKMSLDHKRPKDVPCNNWIHWVIRDGKLDMIITQRSSDIMWGFSGINTFEWSVLHMMMAYWTKTTVGMLTYFISSAHLYDRHWDRAQTIISQFHKRPNEPYNACHPSSDFQSDYGVSLDGRLSDLFAQEAALRNQPTHSTHTVGDPFLDNCLQILRMRIRLNNNLDVLDDIKALPNNDFKLAAVDFYYARQRGEK